MKLTLSVLTLATCAAGMLPVSAADDHTIVKPNDVKWSAGPPVLPKGAEAAVIYGDPSKEGPFAMRLKMPKGYQVPPHTHPKPEINTVISGAVHLGMGETVDPGKAQALPAGSFFALQPGAAHYVTVDEDAVVQLNSSGPWSLNYVNPKDDPRKTQ
jgi:quercetin dioxygenase-like cupin family protein